MAAIWQPPLLDSSQRLHHVGHAALKGNVRFAPPFYTPCPRHVSASRPVAWTMGLVSRTSLRAGLLAQPPPRDSRFGSPLKLSRVHWVRPEVVVEVTYLTWTEDNLLRQVSSQGQREDKQPNKSCGRSRIRHGASNRPWRAYPSRQLESQARQHSAVARPHRRAAPLVLKRTASRLIGL